MFLKKKNQSSSLQFMILMAIFAVACLVFYRTPHIAMWIGFALAGYSAIANDSIQTLGTFISSNKETAWWKLWIFIGGIMLAVLIAGWHLNGGDASYGRLEKIPEVSEFNFLQILAPVILLVLTHMKMPVSTTFLLLSVFTGSKTVGAMLEKTLIGYVAAFFTALVVWAIVGTLIKKKIFFKEKYNKKAWRIFQWGATAYLWTSWLMQDLANITVYLPRTLELWHILVISTFLFIGMGILLYLRGGRIQTVITEKSDVTDVRAASIIDLVFGTILLIFKEWNNLPMSTTWVFLGLLAGREIALAQTTGNDKPYKNTAFLISKDLAFATIGIVASIAIAAMANGDFSISEMLAYIDFGV
jgi:hypothetical protein